MRKNLSVILLRSCGLWGVLALSQIAFPQEPTANQPDPAAGTNQTQAAPQSDKKSAEQKPAEGQSAKQKNAGQSTEQNTTEQKTTDKKAAEQKATEKVTEKKATEQATSDPKPAADKPNADPHAPAVIAPTDDDNYNLLGEFVGEIKTAEGGQPLGLQVRPMGNDRFEARQYTGGLPGQEKFANQSQPLVGQRSGDFLILSGGPWAIFVDKEKCLVIDREGKRLGELKRIERSSPTLGAKPPAGATVLFDSQGTEQFSVGEMTDDGLLLPGADVKPMFQDFNLHVEFRLPYMPTAEGQARGNSGCYLQSRYEVQVLDSFSEAPTFNGCSSLYRQKAPDLNMCLPPLVWQTYDIAFTAPRWAADGSKIRNARITVWHNGVKTQDDTEIEAQTGAGKPEAPTLLPIKFQNHKDPVRFRNIWIIDRGLSPVAEFPISQ